MHQHTELALDKVRTIFEFVNDEIKKLKSGERIPATVLSVNVAKKLLDGRTGSQIYPLIKILLDGYPGVKITIGAKGGVLKL